MRAPPSSRNALLHSHGVAAGQLADGQCAQSTSTQTLGRRPRTEQIRRVPARPAPWPRGQVQQKVCTCAMAAAAAAAGSPIPRQSAVRPCAASAAPTRRAASDAQCLCTDAVAGQQPVRNDDDEEPSSISDSQSLTIPTSTPREHPPREERRAPQPLRPSSSGRHGRAGRAPSVPGGQGAGCPAAVHAVPTPKAAPRPPRACAARPLPRAQLVEAYGIPENQVEKQIS